MLGGVAALGLGAAFYLNGQNSAPSRVMVAAQSGKPAPEMELKRRPSWAAKVCARPAPPAPAFAARSARARAPRSRANPCAAQFEGPEAPLMTRAEVDAKAQQTLKRRPSWAAKFGDK